jgi:hypothetical protein
VIPEEQMQFATRNLLALRGYSQRAVLGSVGSRLFHAAGILAFPAARMIR